MAASWKNFCVLWAVLGCVCSALADWPQLRREPTHSGYVDANLTPPFRVDWAVEFENERLGTAVEPIIAEDRLFVSTHAGSLYALQKNTGQPLWRFVSDSAFLHSPAVDGSIVLAAATDGYLYGLDAINGQLRWSVPIGRFGCSAAPVIAEGIAYLGTRAGDFFAIRCANGAVLWQQSLSAPIRQTAAVYKTNIFVTAEDLRVRCLNATTGQSIWTSRALSGQTARDYYPVIVKHAGNAFIVVRTNPLLGMGQRIGRDRTLLCRNAGVDDSSWQKIDAWTKSEDAHGTPELWATEQKAIREYLQQQPDAQSFYVFDTVTGKENTLAPILWIGGCQSVGAQPAATADGRLFVFYRSAYGNWNHGVAPLVALGLFDVTRNSIAPLFHQQGRQPPWNLFWGTADESQNFLVAGERALLIHQGTLSVFDLESQRLSAGYGNRDTFGGWQNPPWARNEWHGPTRSGVALTDNRLYWQTGSRILCLSSGEKKDSAPQRIRGANVQTERAPTPPAPSVEWMREELNRVVREVAQKTWAPLFVEPGLAGRHFSFDDSSELFEALAWAWPYLSAEVRALAGKCLTKQWREHPPYAKESGYALNQGQAREYFDVPAGYRTRSERSVVAHSFGGVYAAWLYASRCEQTGAVLRSWNQLRDVFDEFLRTDWKLDPSKGDLFANRYLAALLSIERLARLANDPATEQRAADKRSETATALLAWWDRAGHDGTMTNFKGSAELDPFIGKGDAISFRIAPHRHEIALFKDLTPEVAALVRESPAVANVWSSFSLLYQTWWLCGEERQVHFGENFVDPPELALGGFEALAWLKEADRQHLARRIDLPSCRADLFYLTKLALALSAREEKP